MTKTASQKIRELETKLAEAEDRAQQHEKRADELVAQVAHMSEQPAEPELGEPRVLRDPFDVQNPHKFIAHPPGLRLRWAYPTYREHRGWRGWEPVSYDDEIGKNLGRYLNDPPRRMEHRIDNLVRRGDTILCRIDEEIYLARQQRRTERAQKRASAHAADLQDDKSPTISKNAQETSFLR